MKRPNYLMEAVQMLRDAGYAVRPAGRVPGLFDVEGLASDVTRDQLLQLAADHGALRLTVPFVLNNAP